MVTDKLSQMFKENIISVNIVDMVLGYYPWDMQEYWYAFAVLKESFPSQKIRDLYQPLTYSW